MSASAWWQPERLMPLVLVLAIAIDGGARMLPIEWFALRPWEAVRSNPAPGAPFRASFSYKSDRTFGDLALIANLPAERRYRKEAFTTDAHGFRNASAAGETPGVIVVGNSFTAGFGVSDDETLPAQLARHLGRGVYNAGGERALGLEAITALADRLRMSRGLVIYQVLERDALPTVPRARPDVALSPRMRVRVAWYQVKDAMSQAKGALDGYGAYSPVGILAGRAYRQLQNDTILPNRAARHVERRRLQNGEPMLFLASNIRAGQRQREASSAYFSWLAERLAPRGLHLLVLLVPDKSRVYGPLLEAPLSGENSYLADMARVLGEAGVPALDVSPVLGARAKEALASRRYMYFVDDTHWNAEGIAVTAETIAGRLKEEPQWRRLLAPSPER